MSNLSKKICNIKEMVKRANYYGNFRYKLFCFIIAKFGYSNHILHTLEVRNKVYNYVKKKYRKKLDNKKYPAAESTDIPKYLWICWLQGMDNAPDIVKACYNSIKKYTSDDIEINVITEKNLYDYITIPEPILKKWKDNKISNTLFSDIIRFELLVKYGGIWIDSTVMLTDKIPEIFLKKNLFMFQTPKYDAAKTFENWFIIAEKNNRILSATKDLLYEYLNNESKIKDYFITFIIMTIVFEKYTDDYENVIKIPNTIPLMLSECITEKYNEDYFNEIKRLTPVHKLSYKFDLKKNQSDSYYERIIKNNI